MASRRIISRLKGQRIEKAGAEVVVIRILKESKAKAELLSSFSTSLAVVIHPSQLLTRLGLKFTSTMR